MWRNSDGGEAPYLVDCALATKLAWLNWLQVLCCVSGVAGKEVNPAVPNSKSIL